MITIPLFVVDMAEPYKNIKHMTDHAVFCPKSCVSPVGAQTLTDVRTASIFVVLSDSHNGTHYLTKKCQIDTAILCNECDRRLHRYR